MYKYLLTLTPIILLPIWLLVIGTMILPSESVLACLIIVAPLSAVNETGQLGILFALISVTITWILFWLLPSAGALFLITVNPLLQ